MAVGGNILVRVAGQALAVSITLPSGRLPSVTVGGTAVTSMPYTIAADTTFVVAGDDDLVIVATAGGQEVYRKSIRIAEGQSHSCTPTDSYISDKAAYVATIGATATIPSPALYGVSDLTLSANTTLTFPTPAAGSSFTLFLRQDQIGGHAVTWPTVVWTAGTTPTIVSLTTTGKQNLLTASQSGIEPDRTGLTSAAYAATTLARNTAEHASGTACVSLTASGAGNVGVSTTTGTGGVAITAGKAYTAVASFKAASTVRSFYAAIKWYDSAGAVLKTDVGTAGNDNASTWTQKTVTATAPAGAVYAAVFAATAATPAVSEVHYVDCLGLWLGSATTWTIGGGATAAPSKLSFASDGVSWFGESASSYQPVVDARNNPYAQLVGDGTTNDQPALQVLVNALGALYVADGLPRTIRCKAGVYSLQDKGTVWKSGVSLVGDGPGATKFLLSNSGDPTNPTPLGSYTVAQGASTSTPLTDVVMRDFEVDGSAVALASYNTGAKAFVLQYMLRARFQNLYIHDCGASGLGCDFLQDTIIDGVVSNNNGRLNDGTQAGGAGIGIGIGGWGTNERTTITNCTTVGNGTHGIFVELQNNSYTPPHGIRITNCYSEGNQFGISDWGAEGLVVSNCQMLNNLQHGFNVSGVGVGATAGRAGIFSSSVAHGNAVDGIAIGDTATGYVVRGNRVSGNGRYGIHAVNVHENSAYVITGLAVADNDVYDNSLSGIRTDAPVTDGFFLNNRVRNNGQQTDAVASNSGATVSYGLLAVTDTSQSWGVNKQVGKTVTATATGQTAIVRSNTATVLTLWPYHANGTTAWATSTPAAQSAFTLPAVVATRAGLTLNAATSHPGIRGNRFFDNQSPQTQTHGLWVTTSGTLVNGNILNNDFLTNLTAATKFDTAASGTVGGSRVFSSAALSPSATLNVDGTPLSAAPTAGMLGYTLFSMIRFVFSSVGSETVTGTVTATFSDGTTGSSTVTATSSSAVVVASSGLLALSKDGLFATNVAFSMKSSINSSSATAIASLVGTQI